MNKPKFKVGEMVTHYGDKRIINCVYARITYDFLIHPISQYVYKIAYYGSPIFKTYHVAEDELRGIYEKD